MIEFKFQLFLKLMKFLEILQTYVLQFLANNKLNLTMQVENST